jgi:hypothetical protein
MLNIVELVPPPKSVPTNSWNQFRFRLMPRFTEFRPIPANSDLTQFPEFRTEIGPRPHPHASCCVRRSVYSMWMRFRCAIPEFRESVPIPEFPEFRTGIWSPPSPTGIALCSKISPQYVDAIPVRNSEN